MSRARIPTSREKHKADNPGGHGSNPNRLAPSEHPIQSKHENRKPKMGGEFSQSNQNGIPLALTHSLVS